ncbi:MAG: PAS domain S-box protein, partial [Hoeflea sp.]|nr:PAS domain S-box protein [Hoeflea sp.]
EEDRLKAEKVLKTALASISDGFVVYDDQDRLVLCNDAYRAIYPLAAPAMQVGATFESILRYGLAHGQYPEAGETPQSREAWIEARLKSHVSPASQFVQEIAPDRWLQIEEIITEENYRVGVRTDVSALTRVKTEAERLGLIIESVAQEVYLFDVHSGKFLSVNKSARENLQYSIDELRMMTAGDINESLPAEELAELFKHMVSGDSKFLIFDATHKRKDGSTYMCRVRLERMDTRPNPVILAFGEDITERLEFERALERKQQEFESLVRSLPDMIIRAEPDTTLSYVNENFARFYGRDVDDLAGRKFIHFFPPDIRSEILSHLAGLSPEKPIDSFERALEDHEGHRHWFLWTNQMIFEDREPVELISVGRNITESHKAKERIARQSRELAMRNDALEQFAGIVSHDLKAPLRQIRLFAEMIAEDVDAGKTDELEVYSAHISERGRAMEQMISSLLEYSQLAYQAIKPQPFRLSEAVTAAWNNLSVHAAETKAKLSCDTDAEIFADPHLMTQLFQNLFANSIKYRNAPAPAQIRVVVTINKMMTSIAVEDDGIGIDARHAEQIFGVFQRLHRDEREYSGTGIGLALCRRIADSHGGGIVLDTSFSGGARFVISLPNRAHARRAASEL